MRCPKCGMEMPEGTLYCEKCGEEIHIVPDYDPQVDLNVDSALEKIGRQIENAAYTADDPAKFREEKKQPPQNGTGVKVRFYGIVAILFCLGMVILVLTWFSTLNMKRTNSAPYQIKQAEKYQSLGEYEKAIACYARAVQIGGEDIALLEKMASLYYLQNNQAQYENCLRKLLTFDDLSLEKRKDTEEKMISILIKKGDFEGIHHMLIENEDEQLQREYLAYLAYEPKLELKGGEYVGMQSLKITCEGEGCIYYTLDGTIPGENSTRYTLPIILDYGTVTVKACFINAYGVKSKIAQEEYTIERPIEIPQ